MFARFISTLVAALAASAALAQTYPEKSMRMIVPFSVGAGSDLLARLIARKLQEAWGQNMIVENRPGGGTIIGVDMAAKAPPDGYTLVIVTPSFIINATITPEQNVSAATAAMAVGIPRVSASEPARRPLAAYPPSRHMR